MFLALCKGISRHDEPRFTGSKARSCTDVAFCILFLLFILGALTCSAIGFIRGDPRRLIHPTNSAGQSCGQGDLVGKEFLFYFDIVQCAKINFKLTPECPTQKVCVAECPKEYFYYKLINAPQKDGSISKIVNLNQTRHKLICKHGVDPVLSSKSVTELVTSHDCAAYYVPSTSVLSRCIPSVFTKSVTGLKERLTVANQTLKTVSGESFTYQDLDKGSRFLAQLLNIDHYAAQLFSDLKIVWAKVLLGLGLVTGISLLWIFLLRWLVGPIVFFTFVGLAAVLIHIAQLSFRHFYRMKSKKVALDIGLPDVFISDSYGKYGLVTYFWLFCGCASSTILFMLLLIMLFVWKKIRVACTLIEEASISITQMPLVLLVPVLPLALQTVIFVYYVLSVLYIASIGEKEFSSGNYGNVTEASNESILRRFPCDTNNEFFGNFCEFIRYGGQQYNTGMQIYMLFVFFWLMNFATAIGQMTLAGAFASFYWSQDKHKLIRCGFEVFTSFCRCIRYHLGSLALGSLLIAVVQMIRAVLEYIYRKLKRANSKIAIFIAKCLSCCMFCVEQMLKFINKHTYIMIAIYGKSFCSSSRNAFKLILRNILQTVILDKVSAFIIILNQFLLIGIAAVGSYHYWQYYYRDTELKVQVPGFEGGLIPVLIMTFGSFLVTTCAFNVYDMAVDTLFLCFLEDLESNDGTIERPYCMSKNLLKLLRKGKGNTIVGGSTTAMDVAAKGTTTAGNKFSSTSAPTPIPGTAQTLRVRESSVTSKQSQNSDDSSEESHDEEDA